MPFHEIRKGLDLARVHYPHASHTRSDFWQYDSRPLKQWLFRIAHNRCSDFRRKRGVRVEAESAAMSPDVVEPKEPAVLGLGQAVEHLVASWPPKERACVLLKDVFDYSLEEIA